MASYNKIQDFVLQVLLGKHDFSATGHVFKVMATNGAPLATNTVKADLTEISSGNGYPAGGSDIQNDVSQASGTATVTGVDVVWTGSGAGFGPLRYIALYNDTQTSPVDPLVCWWDYGSSISVAAGETFTVDFGASVFTLA